MENAVGGFSLGLLLGIVVLVIGGWFAYWGQKGQGESAALAQLQQGWRLAGTVIIVVGACVTTASVLGLLVVGVLHALA
jgi:hypothetical protein